MIGSEASRYRILSRIGEGGMGEVYLAHDPSLDRKVALKFLPAAQAADDTARRRLLNEAFAAARLDHPFVCKVYEIGESGERPFIAMEYVEGTTLKERLAGSPLPLKEAIRLASEIAEAVDFAHKRGVVHRDLKPSNVMLAADGHVKVMDFGVAKQSAAPAGGATTTLATATGQIVGTMAYMSPEQLRGLPVDARSDVFAFGLVLYEMTTGVHPFARASEFSTADAILNAAEAPLDERRKDAPPLLAHIVARCLEKDRDRRYQSLRDVQIELSTLAAGTGSSARRPVVRDGRRARWVIAAAAAATLAAGGVGLWVWQGAFRSEPVLAFKERDWILITDFENLTGEQVFDRSLRVALEVGLAQSQYVNVFPPQRLQAVLARMKRTPGDRLDEALAAEAAVREGVKAVLACSIAQVGDVYALTARLIDPQSRAAVLTESVQARGREQTLEALDELTARVRRRLGESLSRISQTRVSLPKATTASLDALKMYADSFRLTGRDEGASDELLRQAIALDPDFAMAHAELGRRGYLKPERAHRLEAEAHFVKALGLLDRLSQRERLWIQATADDSRGLRWRAVDGYRTYLAQYPDDARGWFRLGWTYMAGLSQFEPAVDAFNRAIALNASDAGAHINLATSLSALGKYERAVEVYRKAFTLEPELLTGTFVNHEYGFTLVKLGQLDAAADVFGKMKAEADQSKRARAHRSVAFLEMYRGRYDAAIRELHQAVLINQTNGFGVSEFRDHLILARALEAKGMTEAVASELAAVDRLIARLSLGPEWLSMPAKIQARRGRVREARRLLDLMSKTAWNAAADSSTNRNMEMDQAYLNEVRGEIELAERRPAEAAKLLEAAYLPMQRPDVLESIAAAYVAAGRLEDAAKRYEELIAKPPLGNEVQELWFRAHAVLGEIQERLGHPDAARRLYERLLAAWHDGDQDLIALKQARDRLGKLPR